MNTSFRTDKRNPQKLIYLKFRYPWDRVSVANWIKYPNDHTPHVIHVDYLSRKIDPATGVLHTERLLTCRQPVPSFISKLLGAEDSTLFYEKSEVDPSGKTLTLRSRNLTFSNLLIVEETCTYSESPNLSTKLFQDVCIKSFTGWSHIRNAVEEFCAGRFYQNAIKGRLAMENTIERIYEGTKEQVLEKFGLIVEKNLEGCQPVDPVDQVL